MVDIYFAKSGPRSNENTSQARAIAVEDIEKVFLPFYFKYLGIEPPALNHHNPSRYFEHVVIEVGNSEPRGNKLDKPGFFLVEKMTPCRAAELLGTHP